MSNQQIVLSVLIFYIILSLFTFIANLFAERDSIKLNGFNVLELFINVCIGIISPLTVWIVIGDLGLWKFLLSLLDYKIIKPQKKLS